MRSQIEESVELAVPVRVAYNQWTQFESFPAILPGIESVEQIGDTRVRWRARIGGRTFEWVSEISEQIPDKRIAWRSITGTRNAGVVTFHRLSDDRCKVMVQIDHEPESATDSLASVLGLDGMKVARALSAFKDFIENRGRETGSWRGAIPSEDDSTTGTGTAGGLGP